VLEMAYELVGDDDWPYLQALVHMRAQGAGEEWPLALFGSDSPAEIWRVARREVQLAIVNPAAPLALALRGTGPFPEPLPLRMITVLPNEDAYAMAISERTGLTSLEQVRDQHYPLRISVRRQRTHATHLFTDAVLEALGFSLDDIVSWGGQVCYDEGLPAGPSTGGALHAESRLDLVQRGARDALFDEATHTWVPEGLGIGLRPVSLGAEVVQKLEAMGLRRSVLTPVDYPGLSEDVLALDFSGWGVYTYADLADETVTAFCRALERCKGRVQIYGDQEPLPLHLGCKESFGGPMAVPLHPAAERFWREQGYL
jgi:hypothetical protein